MAGSHRDEQACAMTTTPPEAPTGQPRQDQPDDGPRVTTSEVRDLSRLHRTVGAERRVGGVAGGLAKHLDVDPLLLRVAFVVLTLFGGAGLIVYVSLWLLAPEEGTGRATLSVAPAHRGIAILVTLVVGAVMLLDQVAGSGLGLGWPLAVIAAVIGVVLYARRDQTRPGAYPAPQQTSPTAAGPQWTAYAPPRPPDPRKRGPLLVWATLAVIALGWGVLGLVDVSGVDVAPAAYAALAVALTGAALVLSSVWGRGGGLIALGLVSCLALAGTTAAASWDSEPQTITPTSLPADSRFEYGAGDHTIDLTGMTPQELADESVFVDTGAGKVTVIVPDGMAVDAHVEVGLGEATAFGQTVEGPGSRVDGSINRGSRLPHLFVDIQLGLGEATVITEGDAR